VGERLKRGETPQDQDEERWLASNPLVRWLVHRMAKKASHVCGAGYSDHIDVGTGSGLALKFVMGSWVRCRCIELLPEKGERARELLPNIDLTIGDGAQLPYESASAELVTCFETLEHLTDDVLERVVGELRRVTSHRIVITVPWEPWFWLGNLGRGKYLRPGTFHRFPGNHFEHVQHFNRDRITTLLEPHVERVVVHTSFPWLVVESCTIADCRCIERWSI